MEEEVTDWQSLLSGLAELKELIILSLKDGDDGMLESCLEQYKKLLTAWEKCRTALLFTGTYDRGNAIISLHAGTGGVDAQDWTEMLLRMYMRYAEKKNWETKIVQKISGSEAGLKSTTVEVTGSYAYGFLKAEAGVHRLVRISPFDAEKMRHTSFALVEVLPELPRNTALIDEKEIKIDTFRSSGHGGQSVNTTDSAVRVTHIPTGLVVTCQNERSQLQNKLTAIKILNGRLYQLKRLEDEKRLKGIKGDYKAAEWGNQARSYVLQPYKQVKDHRTAIVTSNAQDVLDGNLEDFIIAWLNKQASSSHD